MLIPIDFRASRPAASAIDHAVREAAHVYADQMLDGTRAAFPLLVRDRPADALYQRVPLISADRVAPVDLAVLPPAERQEVAARAYHERMVTLAGALAFQRQTGQSREALVRGLTDRGRMAPLADTRLIERRLMPHARDTENELWMTIHLGRAERFLDRNWSAVTALATAALRAPVDADGWRVLDATVVAARLRQRPVKLDEYEQDSVHKRRVDATVRAGREVSRRLGLALD